MAGADVSPPISDYYLNGVCVLMLIQQKIVYLF